MPAAPREARPSLRAPAIELGIAALVLVAAAVLGWLTGWRGTPKTATATAIWPFYLDTWYPGPVWTWRTILPLAGLLLVMAGPLQRFLVHATPARLLTLLVAAYAVYFGCGVLRHGFQLGLQYTFMRSQEYWQDVRFVQPGFLAVFPEVAGRLSQHGATHPPGLTLLLRAVHGLGAHSRAAGELVCSLAAPLTALPLYGAARRLSDETTARVAVALYLFTCSVTVFAILAMDLVTMLLAAIALYGLTRALDGERRGGVVWGLALAAATLCTFTALTLSLSYAALLIARRTQILGDRRRLIALACGPAAFLAFYGALVLGFGYRPFHVFEANWVAFAASDDARRSPWVALIGNPVAFAGSLGLPLTALVGRMAGGAALRLRRRDDLQTVALVFAALLPPLLCTALGKPRAEVERIYLVFVPMVVLAAAAAARRWYGRDMRWLVRLAVPALIVQSILIEIFTETFW